MENFEGINEFVVVAELQGFSAAAKKLGCSTSHVSRQVSRLEDNLGCALFSRTTRLVSLTPNGELYYQHCKTLVSGLEQANEQVRKQQFQLHGLLRVSVAGTFAEEYVAPALIDFVKQYPDLNLEMDFNSRNINFIEESYDFAIRYGKLADSSLFARKLAARQMVAVAAPSYLARHEQPSHPNELINHSCLISNNDYWHFKNREGEFNVKVFGRFRCNNARALVNACCQGLGIAYMPRSNFADLLEDGAVLPVLEPYWSEGAASWIVFQNRQFIPTRARVAIDYLIEHFQDWKE